MALNIVGFLFLLFLLDHIQLPVRQSGIENEHELY